MLNTALHLFGAFTKVDSAAHTVEGVITSEALDHQGDIVDYAASLRAVEGWRGNIREMHQPSAVGKALEIHPDAEGRAIHIKAHVVDPLAWAKVEAGVYTGFSIGGGKVVRDSVDKRRITDYRLTEVSLVDVPANPTANITLFKLADADAAVAAADAAVEAATDSADLTKAGAAISAANRTKMQAIHDHSVTMGAACGTSADKVAPPAPLTKADPPDPDAPLTKALALVEQHGDTLSKAMQQITALTAQVAALEAQPVGGAPLVNVGGLTAVNKALGGGEEVPPAADPQTVLKGLIATAASPEARQLLTQELVLLQIKQAPALARPA